MKKNKKYHSAFLVFLLGTLLVSSGLIGCQKEELSKEEVEQSSYYKELKEQVSELKSEKKKLEAELEEANESDPDDQRAVTYLKKLKRDSLVKIEIASSNNSSQNIFLTEKAILNAATKLAKNADLTLKYTPTTLAKKYKARYIYTLYDEDNSVFEVTVYDGNYIVFSDLPHKVYYCYQADLLGSAFLTSEKNIFDTSLLSSIEHSSAMLSEDGKKLFTASSIQKFVSLFNETPKEIMEANTQKSEKRSVTYTFYENGTKITMILYETQLSISSEGDDTTIWYQISTENMENLQKIFA